MPEYYEIRDPIHGLIRISELEREVINHPAFQRLRRIKQLALTDMVYPGTTHSRFEHSLGVMHVVSQLFNSICSRQKAFLINELQYSEGSLERLHILIRLAALLHDIGHAPFSHAAEEVFPINETTKEHHVHEEYSAAIAEFEFSDLIDNHPSNHFRITAKDVSNFFLSQQSPDCQIWSDLLSSQMDCDRMDYLLRDSYHAGVNYGKYDLNRLVSTVRLIRRPDSGDYTLGIDEDGIHAAEGLILARYMMFTQLYFHKTRVIYDYHLVETLKEILKDHGGHFPAPTSAASIKEYLKWDDWLVGGEISAGSGGAHGEILRNRQHFRLSFQTSEVPTIAELEKLDLVAEELAVLGAIRKSAGKSWYKFKRVDDEILLATNSGKYSSEILPLSQRSPVIQGLQTINQNRVYLPQENRGKAEEILKKMDGEGII